LLAYFEVFKIGNLSTNLKNANMKRRQFLQNASGGVAAYLSLNSQAHAVLRESNSNSELNYHIIEKVTTKKVRLYYPRFVSKNARSGTHGWGSDDTICEIVTHQGAKGWGVPSWKTSENDVKDFIIGKKVSDVFDPNVGITDPKLRFCDIALHDLSGMILNKPVYEVLGVAKPEIFKCYSGMVYFDEMTPFFNKPLGMELILQECAFDRAIGYRQLKLKIGRGNKFMSKDAGIKRDIEVTNLVAKSLPDCEILVDGNDGYTVDELKRYLDGIGNTQLFWLEEPFIETLEHYQELNAFLKLRNIKTLLADGEAGPIDHELLSRLEDMKLLNVRLTDIQDIGFTGWRKLMPQLKKSNTLASPHAWGSQLKTNVISHLTGTYGNTASIEGVTCVSDDVDLGNYQLKDGKLIPSNAPGFGMKLLV
jgi:D-galactarolactone cycloisomerase